MKLLKTMKFTKCALLFFLMLYSCFKKKDVKDPYQLYPPYKLINLFSRKIQPETDLILRSYGVNCYFPDNYEYINKSGFGNFTASYSLEKNRNDEISLMFARNLIVFLAENLLQDINSNSELRADLDVYPFISDLLHLVVRFQDENKIELGQGISSVSLSRGKVKYKGYEIYEYSDTYPADGKHYTIHEESYAEALEIVKKKGNLRYLQ